MRVLVIFFALSLGVGVYAQDTAPEEGPAPEGSWDISGESLEGSRSGETKLVSPRAEQEGTIITARDGLWRQRENLLILVGDVLIQDSIRTMTSDEASFDLDTKLGIMTGRVRGQGPEGELAAHEVWFWRDENRIELRDSARVEDETRILEATRLDYDTAARTAVATGSVVIVDKDDSTRVIGERCDLDHANDRAVVTGSPSLYQPEREGMQSLTLTADTLEMRQTESVGEARGNVHLTRGNVNARAGNAVFDFENNLLRLTVEPVASDPDGEVTGDSMAVVMRGGRAERLEVLGTAQLRYRPIANPGEINFVTGDTLIAWVDSLGVREIQVMSNARSLYLPSPLDREDQVGSNTSRGREIRVHFADGEAKQVHLRGEASGEYLVPRTKPDTTGAQLSDSAYTARAIDHFLANPDSPLPDSLEASGPFELDERVIYQGEEIVFWVPDRRIEIREAGRVLYQNMELESDEINYEASEDRVVALGEPTLRDQSSELVGERMVYRLDRKQGFVYQGKTAFDAGFYLGDEIKRVDKKILLVKGGDYTTCDADTSHFHFHSRKMKIKVGDRVIARPIILYLKNIPLMALPYWVFPIRRGRHSGVLMPDIEFGFDRDRGRFLRNIGYYWAPNDYADATLWGDYYEKNPRWVVNGQIRYKVRYLLGGDIFTSYSGQESSTGRSKRWDLRGSHEQTLGDKFTLKVRADFVSDKDYRDDREFGGTVDERLNRILKSSIDVRKSWSKTYLSVTASRQENLDEGSSTVQVTQSLPNIDFSVSSFPIGALPDETGRGGRLAPLSTVYARFSSSFRSTFSKPWGEKTQDNQAARVTTGLSDRRTIGRFLTISPSISSTGAWFRRDTRGRSHQAGAVWNAGASATSTIYGTFPINLGPVIGLRHVIDPSVSYRYAPEFESLQYEEYNEELDTWQTKNKFPSVGGISLSGSEVSSMSINLTQKFHLKLRGEDPKKPRKIDNLILWTTGTGYNFLKQGKGEKPFSSISNNLRVNMSRYLSNSWTVRHDPYRKVMTSLSVNSSVRLSGSGRGSGAAADSVGGKSGIEEYGGFGQADASTGRPGEKGIATGGPWSLSLTHSYGRGENRSSESSTMNLSASFSPTANWRVNYSIYYDLRNRDIRSQSFTLRRDLHCWEMKLDRRISGGNSQYYFRINVKSLPDVQYERQKR